MTYWEKYEAAVMDAERWAHEKDMMIQQLKRMYLKQGKSGADTQYLIDADQTVREAQIMYDRAAARAAMYGPGVIIQTLRLLKV